MNSLPPLYTPALFNTNAFQGNNYITKEDADRLYLTIYAGKNLGLIDGITPGIISFSKAVIVDSSGNISGFNNVSLTGSLTASTSVSSSIINSNTYLLTGSNILMSALTSVSAGTGSASKALILDSSRNINNINVLTTSELVISSNIRFVTSANVNYIQSGTAISSNSSADLCVSNVLNTFSASARIFMIKATTGRVGIQSYAPTKQLDINSTTGDCLRLQYGSPTDGTGSNNVDFNVSASGQLTITPSGRLTTLNAPNGGDMLLLTSTNPTTRNTITFQTDISSMEFGSRSGSAGAYPNSLYIYTNGSYKWVLNANSGDTQILSTTDTTAINTGSFQLLGGLSIVKNVYTTGSLTVDRSGGSNLNLKNGANFAFLEVSSTNMLRLVAGNSGNMAVNIDSNGVVIGNGTATAKCRLDLGATASNMTLSLFNNTTSYYGISANNSSLQYSAFGSHNWYSSCSNASPINFNCMSLTSGGTLTTAENLVAGTGIWCKQGFNSTGRSGNGTAVLCGSSYGEIYSYDYGISQYKPLYVGNVMYVSNSAQSVNIGGGANTALYPLQVQGYSATTFAPYGYLSSGGAGSGGSSGVVNVSIWAQHRIACTEFNAYSDKRLKTSIHDILSDDALEFVKSINPKIYNWKAYKGKQIGYIAQDILKLKNNKWDTLVSLSEDQELEEEIEKDGFINPKGKRLQLNYSGIIPILHSALKHALDEIEDLKEKLIKTNNRMINNNKLIFDLEQKLLDVLDKKTEDIIIDFQTQINTIIDHLNI